MFDLRGSHVLVTGASRGLGPVIAEALAEQGARLTLAARSPVELEAARERVARRGTTAVAVVTDVADRDQRARLVETARAELGPIDVLVNNAGLESSGAFVELDPAELAQVVDVNLTAALALIQLVLPDMLDRRRGHIVNLSSIAGKSGGPYGVVYCATKAGLLRATEALRAELAGTGVSASAICPGFVRDEGMYARMADQTGARVSRVVGETSPQKVATAVVKAITTDAAELIVSPGPFRALAVLTELVPPVRRPVTNWLVRDQMERVARYRHEQVGRPAG